MIYVRDITEKMGGTLVCGNVDLKIENISKDFTYDKKVIE